MTPKEIAIEICKRTVKGIYLKAETEKMMGKKFELMTKDEKELALAVLSAFEN